MNRRNILTLISTAFVWVWIALPAFPALAENVAPKMTVVPRLAIGGYDTVAYHTVGKAVPGTLDYQVVWHDARWQFASKENLDLFNHDPEKYAAQYDDIAPWASLEILRDTLCRGMAQRYG
jgi:hypothetical protein